MGNHQHAPDASHPVYLEKSTVTGVEPGGLFYLTGPDPAWRNEADCGEEVSAWGVGCCLFTFGCAARVVQHHV